MADKCKKIAPYGHTFNSFLAFSISCASGWFALNTLSTCQVLWKFKYFHDKIKQSQLKSILVQLFSITSLTSVSVWSICISSKAFFPIPFCDGNTSFFDCPFVPPLPPLPAPGILSRPTDLFIPRPDPPKPPRLIPGSSPTHWISSGEIWSYNIVSN